jgi:hypothetical protein
MTRPAVQEMPERERPLSEQYRLAANSWCDLDAAARRLEELKTTALEQQKNAIILAEGPMADSHAERKVKSAPSWEKYIVGMVNARTEANRAKVEMEVIKMQEREIRDRNEAIRAEMRLSGR